MAESIKGISVVIEGDTTGLSKALSEVNKATKETQSELKLVDKLLRLDPTNTELLAQKQQLLTNAVESTKEKLDRLKAAQEQVNDQFAKGEINEGQYRAFQREITATEQQLEKFEERLKSSSPALESFGAKAKETGDKLSEAGDKVKGVGEKMSIGITAPIAAAGAAMLKGAVDAEMAQGKLQATLGITADAAADLEAVAEAVWANGFGDNIQEVNDNIAMVRKNIGDLAEDEMQKVTEGAMTISELFGADIADSTKSAGTLMKNFGLDGQAALDLITVGFQKGGDYSGELLDTLNEYSPQFASMGMSADQMMGILISGAQAGAFNLDKVGDAVKEFNIRAQDGSKTTADGFSLIGLNAQQMGEAIAKGGEDGQKAFMATVTALAAMKDPMQQNIAGTELFGTQWEDVRSKVITAMAEGTKGIGDFKGATDEATQAMRENNPGIELTKAMRELQLAIGPALLPLADIIKNTIAPAVKSLADGFASLSPAGQQVALAIAGIMAIIGPALIIIGSLIGAVGSIAGVFSAASGAIAAAGGAIAIITGPIGIAVAAITAFAALAYLVISNWGPIKDFFSGLWTDITTTIDTSWTDIKKFFADTWNSITTNLIEAWQSMKNRVSDGLDAIKKIIKPALDFYEKIFDETWNIIKNVVLGAVLIILDIVTGNFTQLGTDMQNIWNNIKNSLSAIWELIKNTVIASWTSMKESVTSLTTAISDTIRSIWESILSWFTTLPSRLKQYAVDMFTAMRDGVTATVTEVKNAVVNGLESAWTYIKGLPSQALQWGKDIIQGLINGIKAMIADVKKIVGDLVDEIIKKIRSALDINSPSKVTMKLDLSVGEGLVLGMQNTLAEVSRQAQAMANAAIPNVTESKGAANGTSSISGSGGITQYISIQSPTALSPSETARQVKNASRRLALEW